MSINYDEYKYKFFKNTLYRKGLKNGLSWRKICYIENCCSLAKCRSNKCIKHFNLSINKCQMNSCKKNIDKNTIFCKYHLSNEYKINNKKEYEIYLNKLAIVFFNKKKKLNEKLNEIERQIIFYELESFIDDNICSFIDLSYIDFSKLNNPTYNHSKYGPIYNNLQIEPFQTVDTISTYNCGGKCEGGFCSFYKEEEKPNAIYNKYEGKFLCKLCAIF